MCLGSRCIGRKDRLQRTISAMTRLHGDEFGFHPDGFSLPKDGGNLERCLRNDSASSRASKKGGNLWIVKPLASSCGRGIRVITAEKALAYAKSNKKMLVQRYALFYSAVICCMTNSIDTWLILT